MYYESILFGRVLQLVEKKKVSGTEIVAVVNKKKETPLSLSPAKDDVGL